VRPFSRIDWPQDGDAIKGDTFTLSGIAFSDDSGLAQVEISWDDTGEWQPAELTRDRVSNYLGGVFPDGTAQMQWVLLVFGA